MFVNIFCKTIFNAVAVWGHCAEMNVLSFISVNKCSLNTDAISTCHWLLCVTLHKALHKACKK